ncbi:glycosyltransferase [Tamlana fucoidanivorans]|uniref:Glycosyltransferase n=1 Tax=Allotamlana fucoidanivorans TaxID=2583814 RepID=A0A5C4SJ99_9FLAO|nr:glycosyltransferase [Tamlana fucoidanivorans]TNJ43838.1 glycosyltransferase [Tamlana fucoidanivorans]
MNYKISIIIPTLNEEVYIGKLLEHLLSIGSEKHIAEIIVVDGGSQDKTSCIVKAFSNVNTLKNLEAFHYIQSHGETDQKQTELTTKIPVIFVKSQKGRAIQMNLGAKIAQGSVLYFLHADSFPPQDFDTLILHEIEQGHLAGCFRMQFNSNHWWLRLAGWFTQFNWRACRGGDQSQFITSSLFQNIGGFDERFKIYEDNILINALYQRKMFVVINKPLKTSSRMYEKHGVWKLQYFYWTIYVKRWLGASAEDLFQYYKNNMT